MNYEIWCCHFNGIQNTTCRCFKDQGCTERCEHVSSLTPEEVAEKMKESSEALRKYLAALDNNICPHCGQHIQEKKQVGRCVYSWPCNHRLYQGTLPKTTYSIMDHPFFREQRGDP